MAQPAPMQHHQGQRTTCNPGRMGPAAAFSPRTSHRPGQQERPNSYLQRLAFRTILQGRRGFPTLLMRKLQVSVVMCCGQESPQKSPFEPGVHAGFLTPMPLNLASVSGGGTWWGKALCSPNTSGG